MSKDRGLDNIMPESGDMFTRVLNGIGNATMLAAIPLAAFSDVLPKKNRTAFFAITGVAVTLGAWWGYSEAKQHKNYRKALADRLNGLEQKIDALQAENASWRDKALKKESGERVLGGA